MRRFVYETLHPEIYHGFGKKSPYFEGWYYKIISGDELHRYAIIPGVFRTQKQTKDHAFIQVLDGMTGRASYHEYPLSTFQSDEEIFDVQIGPNRFRKDCISLNINDTQLSLVGELYFAGGEGWPVSILEPGVMGWYAWLPFMECYHGILSFDHSISGTLYVDGKGKDFTGGTGYMEKDWGEAFPSAYVWMQSNHFMTPHTSLSASIAIIPSVGRSFAGHIAGFYHHRKLYKMTTYTGAKVEKLQLTDAHVYYTLRDKHHRLEMIAERQSGGLLKAPIRTEMHKRVDETMQSTVEVQFSEVNGKTIFSGTGRNTALEVHGELDRLMTMV